MTLLELIKHLRESILDDVGGQGVDWQNICEDDVEAGQLRWKNEELTRFINEAQKQACRDALLIKDHSDTFDIAVVANTSTYNLDSRIIKIKAAYLESTGDEVNPIEYEDLLCTKGWRTHIGEVTHYVHDIHDGTIQLYKEPDANDTLNLIVYRLPLTDLRWDTAETQSPEIREEYHLDMLNYAAALAYRKDEANTFDPERSLAYTQLYEREFGHTNAYSETRRRRSRGRTIQYKDVI